MKTLEEFNQSSDLYKIAELLNDAECKPMRKGRFGRTLKRLHGTIIGQVV
jgi:hypothetical protein